MPTAYLLASFFPRDIEAVPASQMLFCDLLNARFIQRTASVTIALPFLPAPLAESFATICTAFRRDMIPSKVKTKR